MLSGILGLILETVGGFFTMLLLVRTGMRWMRMSFINQLGQFVLATTNWIVVPAQRVLPSIGKLDLSALVPAWAVQMLLVVLGVWLAGMSFGTPPLALTGVLLIGLLKLFKTAIYLLMGAIIISVVISWVNPYSPIAPILNAFTRPFLQPFRRVIPPVANVDLSPLVLLLVIQIVLFIVQSAIGQTYPLLFV